MLNLQDMHSWHEMNIIQSFRNSFVVTFLECIFWTPQNKNLKGWESIQTRRGRPEVFTRHANYAPNKKKETTTRKKKKKEDNQKSERTRRRKKNRQQLNVERGSSEGSAIKRGECNCLSTCFFLKRAAMWTYNFVDIHTQLFSHVLFGEWTQFNIFNIFNSTAA